MTEEKKLMNKLEAEGFTDQYRVENNRLMNLSCNKDYGPEEVTAVNFYRYEGPSNPDDMSILYAIETTDGRKGTLMDAYGTYSDDDLGAFMQSVEIHKKAHDQK